MTAIGERVYETLDYTLQERCLTLVHGLHRIGKSKAAEHWCELHPGIARFVEVPPGTDDISFFRTIARALGISISTGVKAVQLRERIESVLSTGHLVLVLDEGHRLWPERNYRDAVPFRVSWVMAMVNSGVPVCIITTQQFFDAQKMLEKRSGWNSGQFLGRMAHCEVLPETLSREDLDAVARAFLPDGDAETIKALSLYAKVSAKYLKGIEDAVRRARFLARKEGRDTIMSRDLASAIKGSVIPSDVSLAEVTAKVPKRKQLPQPVQMGAPDRGQVGQVEAAPGEEGENRIFRNSEEGLQNRCKTQESLLEVSRD